MTLKLCLLSINPTQFKDKDTGEEIMKYKYIFLSEKGIVHVGWSDEQKFIDRVTNSDEFDSARAHAYVVNADAWNGKLTYKVDLNALSHEASRL